MSWTKHNNYYVEYLNGNKFNNVFCDCKTFQKLKKCPWIKILQAKKANKKMNKWENVTL